MPPPEDKEALYSVIILHIFRNHYDAGLESFEFERSEIAQAADELGLEPPANVGDLIYSFRFRKPLPDEIRATAAEGREWIIELAGRARYRFRLAKVSRVIPRPDLVAVKVPDATPEIIGAYALSDEQALLAKVRYNRLLDIFLGIAAYSLQNHLRTTVEGIGQIEIDELYVGVNRHGSQFVIPVQAKGGTDQIGVVQTAQDMAYCRDRFPNLVCRAIAAQFMADARIAMFERTIEDDEVRVVSEQHYKLVPASDISPEDLKKYRGRQSTDT